MNVLISLHKGYGLGDAVQMSAVLQHVAKYRPEWEVDYQAEEGKHQVGREIVERTFAYGDNYPSPHYDAEVQICLYDTWANWGDRPNTRVSSALHERFGLPWDRSCGRYKINVRQCCLNAADSWFYGYICESDCRRYGGRYVAIHYQGDSSQEQKNLTHDQALEIGKQVDRLGYEPIILDWRGRSELPFRKMRIPQHWGRDAEMVCAVIRKCSAFVGIDSGPSKCASATDVPSLVTWTGHHPAPFHDPAPNTTHLVPAGYHGLKPVFNDRGVIDWFEQNYNVRQYEKCPVTQINRWLSETLR